MLWWNFYFFLNKKSRDQQDCSRPGSSDFTPNLTPSLIARGNCAADIIQRSKYEPALVLAKCIGLRCEVFCVQVWIVIQLQCVILQVFADFIFHCSFPNHFDSLSDSCRSEHVSPVLLDMLVHSER